MSLRDFEFEFELMTADIVIKKKQELSMQICLYTFGILKIVAVFAITLSDNGTQKVGIWEIHYLDVP